MSKERKADKRRQEDRTLNRVLGWFGGAVVLEFLLLLLNRFYVHFDTSGVELAYGLAKLLEVLIWVGLAAAVASGVWLGLRRSRGKSLAGPAACLAASGVVTVCAFVARTWKDVGVQFLYVTVPVSAVLALVYWLYQREFFLIALQGGMALLGMWAYIKLFAARPGLVYGIFALALALAVGMAVLTWRLQRADGRLGGRQVLDKGAGYPLLYASSAMTAAALVVALVLGRTAAFVALFAVVAWLFAAAVYYTVKMM